MKELLDVSKATINVFHAIGKISHATSKVVQLRLHAIEAAFDRSESLLSRGRFTISLLWCQAAYEMVLFRVLFGTSFEIKDTGFITCVAYIEVI